MVGVPVAGAPVGAHSSSRIAYVCQPGLWKVVAGLTFVLPTQSDPQHRMILCRRPLQGGLRVFVGSCAALCPLFPPVPQILLLLLLLLLWIKKLPDRPFRKSNLSCFVLSLNWVPSGIALARLVATAVHSLLLLLCKS
jgi:hypothetical protein